MTAKNLCYQAKLLRQRDKAQNYTLSGTQGLVEQYGCRFRHIFVFFFFF